MSDDVKRYDIRSYDSGFPPIVLPRTAGAWVSYDDHDAAVSALASRLAEAERDAARYRWLESRISRTGLETRYYNGGLYSQDQRWYHVDYRNPVPESETLSEYIDSQLATHAALASRS